MNAYMRSNASRRSTLKKRRDVSQIELNSAARSISLIQRRAEARGVMAPILAVAVALAHWLQALTVVALVVAVALAESAAVVKLPLVVLLWEAVVLETKIVRNLDRAWSSIPLANSLALAQTRVLITIPLLP